MAEYPWRPLGEILVRRGLIDEYQLESLLLEQRLTGQLFGELLVSRKIISPDDMAAIVAEQHGLHLEPENRPVPPEAASTPTGRTDWRPLGRILVEQGVLTESGLQRVLLAQRRRGGLLGELLLQRGYVTPVELAQALAEQHGLTVDAELLETAAPLTRHSRIATVFEVRLPGCEDAQPLYTSPSFLDASDFAFELLESEDPGALEVVKVDGDDREIAWSYEPPLDETATTSWV